MLGLSEAGQRAAALGIAAAIALAVWLVLLLVLAWRTRPDLPDAAPSTPDFGGPEPPAVVNFLVNRWEVGHEAVPATLLDLAARGVVAIEQVAPERFVCRLRTRAGTEPLADYERQVLDHIRRLAHDGVVPCEALTTGPDEESSGWWDRFRKAVVADARARGLSRSRWSRSALTALAVVAAAPALLTAAAFVALPDDPNSSEDDDPVGAFLAVGAVVWGGLCSVPLMLRAERDTPEGKAAAAKWLGLQAYLHDSESFERAPPAAVAIWDRYLAYGAATGAAAAAVRALPLGSESDTEAWSSYGGKWHVVRVSYPAKIPPGYGQHPLKAAAKGLLVVGAAVIVLRTVGVDVALAFGDLLEEIPDEGWRLAVLAFSGVVLAVATVFLLRSTALLLLGVVDLFAKVRVEGLVVRLRNGYLAVDDGQQPKVRAWRVEPMKLGPATRGSVVRVTASRWLGYVWQVEPLAAPAPGPLEPASAAPATPATPAPVPLDLDALAARTGVRLSAAHPPAPWPGADQGILLTDGAGGSVVVMEGANLLLQWVTGRGEPVDGLDAEARWASRRNVLTARRGDRHVTVVAALPALTPEHRLDVARAIAAEIL